VSFNFLVFLAFFLSFFMTNTSKALTCREIFPNLKSTLPPTTLSSFRNQRDDVYQRTVVEPFSRDYRTCDTCVFGIEQIIASLDLSEVNPQGKILLAGDQKGSALARYIRNGDVYTLDLSNPSGDPRNVRGTVTSMPFPSGSFNFVFSHMVIHYLRAQSQMNSYAQREGYGLETNMQTEFISEVIRVLKWGGEARIGPVLYDEGQRLASTFREVTMVPNNTGEYFLFIKK
jgi:SAM-dependent methyltransferase